MRAPAIVVGLTLVGCSGAPASSPDPTPTSPEVSSPATPTAEPSPPSASASSSTGPSPVATSAAPSPVPSAPATAHIDAERKACRDARKAIVTAARESAATGCQTDRDCAILTGPSMAVRRADLAKLRRQVAAVSGRCGWYPDYDEVTAHCREQRCVEIRTSIAPLDP